MRKNRSLDQCEWKAFFIDDLAEIVSGQHLGEKERTIGPTPYTTATANNNGVGYFVANSNDTLEANCLSVNSNGSVGHCFYHPYKALYSGDTRKLRLKKGNKYVALFIAVSIAGQRDKYGYGYKMGTARLKRQHIMLPADAKGNPDWRFMEQFMREKEQDLLRQAMPKLKAILANADTKPPKAASWEAFFLEDVALIRNGKRLTKADMQSGKMPFVGASETNNGITGFTSSTNESLDSNVLGVNYNGSVGFSFYHPYKALFSDDVKRVCWKEAERNNKYTLLFLSTAIWQQKDKYAYGYKFNTTRMLRQKIMLPITNDGTLDWQYMEDTMRAKEQQIARKAIEKMGARIEE